MIESIVSFASSDASAASTGKLPFSDALSLGGSVTLIGVLIVFSALVCLIFITWLYPKIALPLIAKSGAWKERRAVKKAAKKGAKQAAKAEKKQAPVSQPEQTAAADMAEKVSAADDQALIAVITAAIAASLGTSSNGIVIKSLRRSVSSVSSWGREARNEQVYNRF